MTNDQVTVQDAGPVLRATVLLPGCTARSALSAFTDPPTLHRWWSGELRTTLAEQAPYVVDFPALGRTVTGEVCRYEPDRLLEFGWRWAHAPDDPPCRVTVTVSVGGASATRLVVEHGPYRDDEAGRKARAEHRAGWEYFLPRLAAGLAPAGSADRGLTS